MNLTQNQLHPECCKVKLIALNLIDLQRIAESSKLLRQIINHPQRFLKVTSHIRSSFNKRRLMFQNVQESIGILRAQVESR